MGTIVAMETIVFAVTGKNTSSPNTPEIGSGIGTAVAIIGGTATDAVSLADHG